MQAEHLADLHRGALQLTQRLHDPRGVAHEILGSMRLFGQVGAGHVQQTGPDHRGPDATRQATQLDQAQKC